MSDYKNITDGLRNGLLGVYFVRKELISSMLSTSTTIGNSKMPWFVKRYFLMESLREQIKAIRELDVHLKRMNEALFKLKESN